MYVYLITRQLENGLDTYDFYVADTLYKVGDKVEWDYEDWFIDLLLEGEPK